jgi:membrane-associated protease RseP (regulator of RpoE activity)
MEATRIDRLKMAVVLAAFAAGSVLAAATPAPSGDLTPEERARIEKRMGELGKEMRDLGRKLGEDGRVQAYEFNRVAMNRAMLGITVDNEASNAKGDGVHVAGISPRGPAASAGLRAGDVITAIDGKPLKQDGDDTPFDRLRAQMEGKDAGDEVKLKVLRDGKTIDATVKVESYAPRAFGFAFGGPGMEDLRRLEMLMPPGTPMPPMAPMAPMAPMGPGVERFRWFSREWGDLEMVGLSPKLGEYFGAKDGVLVVHAPDDGAIKLQDGDVITKVGDRKPTSPEQVLRILRSYDSGDTLKLEVLRNRKTMTLDVKVPERGAGRGGDALPEGVTDIIVRP